MKRPVAAPIDLSTAKVRPITPKPQNLDPATGRVLNEASISKVDPSWRPLLAHIVSSYQEACGSTLAGVYLRGSLPMGHFLPGISDVDTFAIVLLPPPTCQQHKELQDEMLYSMRQLVREQLKPLRPHFQGLGYTKIEVKILPLSNSHPAAQQHLAMSLLPSSISSNNNKAINGLQQQQQQQQQQAAGGAPSDAALTPSVATGIPASFQLASQSITLWGWDLPQLLPPSAGVPGHFQLLVGLLDDIELAQAAASEAQAAGNMRRRVAAVRWCLKRLIRASFELTQAVQDCWTRDLYWAVHLAAPHLPLQAPSLNRALQLYVELAPRVERQAIAASTAAAPGAGGSGTAGTAEAASGPSSPAAAAASGPGEIPASWRRPEAAAAAGAAAAGAAAAAAAAGPGEIPASWRRQPRPAAAGAEAVNGSSSSSSSSNSQGQPAGEPESRNAADSPLSGDEEGDGEAWEEEGEEEDELPQLSPEAKRALLCDAATVAAVAEAEAVIASLAKRLDHLFLLEMLREEPGWISHHQPRTSGQQRAAAAAAAGAGLGHQQHQQQQGGAGGSQLVQQQQQQRQQMRQVEAQEGEIGSLDRGQQQVQEQQQQEQEEGEEEEEEGQELDPAAEAAAAAERRHWLQQLQQRVAWVVGSRQADEARWQQQQQELKLGVLGPSGTEEEVAVAGGTPPFVAVPVVGAVRRLDWSKPVQRAAAAEVLLSCLRPQSSAAAAARAAATPPLVLAGAAAGWPAISRWSLKQLAGSGFRGKVRVSPSLQFPFCEPQLLELLVQLRGAAAAPSMEVEMGISEFVSRLQLGCSLPPLVYTTSPRECYYLQAEVPQELLPDLGLNVLLRDMFESKAAAGAVLNSGSGSGSGGSSSSQGLSHSSSSSPAPGPLPAGVWVSQAPRMWVSPPGAVSPCHYDTSTSFLVQLRGRKRLLFFSPDQLPALAPYPDTHILRRRARLNLNKPQWRRYPLGRDGGLGAREVVLEPGDALVFPPGWAHHTESLSTSVSVTVRLQAQQRAV